jgi:hypothetical protein
VAIRASRGPQGRAMTGREMVFMSNGLQLEPRQPVFGHSHYLPHSQKSLVSTGNRGIGRQCHFSWRERPTRWEPGFRSGGRPIGHGLGTEHLTRACRTDRFALNKRRYPGQTEAAVAKERKPRRGGPGNEDEYDRGGHAEVFAMTVRHGTDYAKRFYDRLYLTEGHDEPER